GLETAQDMDEGANSMRRRILSVAAASLAVALAVAGPFPAAARVDTPPAAPAAAAPVASAPTAEEAAPLAFEPAAPNPAIPADYEQVAETPSTRLYINRSDSKLIVEDK